MQLTGKVAIVTGGSQGIGEAIAREYAKEGAKVAILNRTTETAATVCHDINAHGGEAIAVRCDLCQVGSIDAAAASVRGQFGAIDILVNNAGSYLLTRLGETEESAVDSMLDVNIKGVFFLSQAVLPDFEQRKGGKIINIGSIFGNTGFPGSAVYCATKGAVALLTKALALELRDRNIQVNSIAPGWIETPMNEEYRQTDKDFVRRADERFGGEGVWMKPAELVGAAVFLATAASQSITGTTLFVDRGWAAY